MRKKSGRFEFRLGLVTGTLPHETSIGVDIGYSRAEFEISGDASGGPQPAGAGAAFTGDRPGRDAGRGPA